MHRYMFKIDANKWLSKIKLLKLNKRNHPTPFATTHRGFHPAYLTYNRLQGYKTSHLVALHSSTIQSSLLLLSFTY